MNYAHLKCTKGSFQPCRDPRVRWLDMQNDFDLAVECWRRAGRLLSLEDWQKAHADGYQYCAITEDSAIVAIAAAWKYSEEAWEVAAVGVAESHRRQGLGRAVVSFVTEHILSSGRLATCTTGENNEAMIQTARSVGFVTTQGQSAQLKNRTIAAGRSQKKSRARFAFIRSSYEISTG